MSSCFQRCHEKMERVQGNTSSSVSTITKTHTQQQKRDTCMPHSSLKSPPSSHWLPGNSSFGEENQATAAQNVVSNLLFVISLGMTFQEYAGSEREVELFLFYSTCTSTHRKHGLVQSTHTSKSHDQPV